MHAPVPKIPDGMTIFTECPTDSITVPRVRVTYEHETNLYGYVAWQVSPHTQKHSHLDQTYDALRDVLGKLAKEAGDLNPDLIDLHRDVCYWNLDGRTIFAPVGDW